MTIHEYQILKEIITELSMNDIEGLQDFINDCQTHDATWAVKYILNQFKNEDEVDRGMVIHNLNRDLVGS